MFCESRLKFTYLLWGLIVNIYAVLAFWTRALISL